MLRWRAGAGGRATPVQRAGRLNPLPTAVCRPSNWPTLQELHPSLLRVEPPDLSTSLLGSQDLATLTLAIRFKMSFGGDEPHPNLGSQENKTFRNESS